MNYLALKDEASCFTEGARYRRRGEIELHVYRSSDDYRDFILLPRRVRKDEVPKINDVRRWYYDGVVVERSKATLILGIRNLDEALRHMEDGFYRGYQTRITRAG